MPPPEARSRVGRCRRENNLPSLLVPVCRPPLESVPNGAQSRVLLLPLHQSRCIRHRHLIYHEGGRPRVLRARCLPPQLRSGCGLWRCSGGGGSCTDGAGWIGGGVGPRAGCSVVPPLAGPALDLVTAGVTWARSSSSSTCKPSSDPVPWSYPPLVPFASRLFGHNPGRASLAMGGKAKSTSIAAATPLLTVGVIL